MLSRRHFLAFSAAALPATLPHLGHHTTLNYPILGDTLHQLEQANGGRLGVSILDTHTGERVSHRASELFPMCSTFKFLLTAAILHRVDHHKLTLDRTLPIPPLPLLGNSPLTTPHAGGQMDIFDLANAAMTRSDNTAANLLLDLIGGPAALTAWLRTLGDRATRLDRNEPALNESLPNDPRDSTTPADMVENLSTLLLGHALSPDSRSHLLSWMQSNQTGLERLRANIPASWQPGDKTGSNGEHTSNDIAIFFPPQRKPILVAAYITQCPGPESKRATMLATIGSLIAKPLL